MDINRNNCESFFLLYLDKELNTAEQAEVENFLKKHTDLQKEFNLLQLTKQWPGEIVFDQKELLYHNEEKRRAIPVYWTRIAATLVLILAGTLFMMSLLRNYRTDISGKKLSIVAVDDKKNHLDHGSTEKLNPSNQKPSADTETKLEQKKQTEYKGTPDHASQNSSRTVSANPKKSSAPGSNSRSTTTGDQRRNSSEHQNADGKDRGQTQDSPDDLAILMPKSNTSVEVQTSSTRSAVVATGQSLGTTKAPALVIAVAGKNSGSGMENEDLADIQTDNSISVIALNDRNKGITSFFKKLTQRTSGNETADNTKKLRVSVFRFSY